MRGHTLEKVETEVDIKGQGELPWTEALREGILYAQVRTSPSIGLELGACVSDLQLISLA